MYLVFAIVALLCICKRVSEVLWGNNGVRAGSPRRVGRGAAAQLARHHRPVTLNQPVTQVVTQKVNYHIICHNTATAMDGLYV